MPKGIMATIVALLLTRGKAEPRSSRRQKAIVMSHGTSMRAPTLIDSTLVERNMLKAIRTAIFAFLLTREEAAMLKQKAEGSCYESRHLGACTNRFDFCQRKLR